MYIAGTPVRYVTLKRSMARMTSSASKPGRITSEPPREEERLHRARHRVLVVERHRDQGALGVVGQQRLAHDVGVPELPAVGQQHALGLAGGARRVGLHARLVEGGGAAGQRGRGRGQHALVGQRAVRRGPVGDHVLDGRDLRGQHQPALGQRGVGHQHGGLRVLRHVAKRLVAHPDIERHRHRPEPHRAEEHVMGGGGSAIVDTYRSVSILQGVADFLHAIPSTPGCTHNVLYDSGWPARYDVFQATHFDDGLVQQVFSTRDWTGPSKETTRPDLNEDRVVTPHNGSIRWAGRFTARADGNYYVIVHDGRTADHHTVYVDGHRLSTVPISANELYYIPFPRAMKKGESVQIRFDYLPNDTQVYPGLGVLNENEILSDRARRIAAKADAVLIAAGFDKSNEHEGSDRTFALPPLQDTMIRNLAALNHRTILAITAGGNVDMKPWIDRIQSLLFLWYPGEEGGTALADILFGVQNPEGKLPDTFEAKWEDNSTFHSYYPQDNSNPAEPHIHYAEGVFLGYRYFDSSSVNTAGVQPRFPFGFGLSYTTFAFSNLRVSRSTIRPDDSLTVTLTIRNTGKVAGADVAQIYIGEQHPAVPRPRYELKAFQKVRLAPGESRTITLPLNRRSFAYWSQQDHAWKVDPGFFTIYAGDSSASVPLHADLTMEASGR